MLLWRKPPVPTIDEFDSLREVEKETGQFCSVGFSLCTLQQFGV